MFSLRYLVYATASSNQRARDRWPLHLYHNLPQFSGHVPTVFNTIDCLHSHFVCNEEAKLPHLHSTSPYSVSTYQASAFSLSQGCEQLNSGPEHGFLRVCPFVCLWSYYTLSISKYFLTMVTTGCHALL